MRASKMRGFFGSASLAQRRPLIASDQSPSASARSPSSSQALVIVAGSRWTRPAREARSGGEGAAAAARRLGVRVLEDEAAPLQAVGEVERHAVEHDVRLLVDEDLHALVLERLVVGGRVLVERQ